MSPNAVSGYTKLEPSAVRLPSGVSGFCLQGVAMVFSRGTRRFLRAIMCFLAMGFGAANAQARNFQTTLFDPTGNNPNQSFADLSFFTNGQPQPAGQSVMALSFWGWFNTPWDVALANSGYQYDFSRIKAVLIDEPYWWGIGYTDGANMKTFTNPCAPGQKYCPDVGTIYNQLQQLGKAIKQTSPNTRFWINFSAIEVQWMGYVLPPPQPSYGFPAQTLYGSFVDVISVDLYTGDFNGGLLPYYTFLIGSRVTSAQQIALVPGDFADPSLPAGMLADYFNYANQANEACNLSVGGAGITGSFDGCLVWDVLGFQASTLFNNPAVGDAWKNEASYTIQTSVQPAAAAAITSVVYPLNN
jgi:hypothetical protein